MRTRLVVAALFAGPVVVLATAAPALAGATASSRLDCGAARYDVTGFGRGQALHVVGTTQVFVVTFAQVASGEVVFSNPGLADSAGVVTCTTTSPGGTLFTFRGFFTPRG